jgi:alcohol dehydrogenase class IV
MPASLNEIGIGIDRIAEMAEAVIKHYGKVGSFKELSAEDIMDILTNAL